MENKIAKYLAYIKQIQGEEGAQKVLKAWSHYLEQDKENPSDLNFVLGVMNIMIEELNTYSSSLVSTIFVCGFQSIPAKKFILDSFGEDIWRIIEGAHNIKKLNTEKAISQPDFHRQLILSVSNDMRAVLLQLATHLYLLRNLSNPNSAKGKELLNIIAAAYIPIAHRLGFYKMKSEMEDIVLKHTKPEVYASIKQKLKETEKKRKEIIDEFVQPIVLELDNHHLNYQIKSRVKSINSIYLKMKNQEIPFEKVYDLWAIRIILQSDAKMEKADCWHAYSVVTNIYKPDLSRLRDWITVPKSSGYESLHATVQAKNKRSVEVQIRTVRMDDEAENGLAAHWKYKGGKGGDGIDHWLSQIKTAIQEDGLSSSSFGFETAKNYANEIFVFTPQGDLKKLGMGATVLDFAYNIHTDVGSHCTNALVNGKIVPIRYVLQNGDQVQIITSKSQKPSIDWLKFVVSNRTKLKIKKALDEERLLDVKRGKEILERRFKNWKMELSQEVIKSLVEHYKFKQIHDLFLNVSLEKLDPLDIKKVLLANNQSDPEKDALINTENQPAIINEIEQHKKTTSDDILVVDQIDRINFKFAKCCNPIPGDAIFGFVTVTKGITIHRNNCPNAPQMKERFPYRLIQAQWKTQKQKLSFKSSISIEGADGVGLLNKITQVISNDLRINIINSKFKSTRNEFSGLIKVFVHDIDHLEILIEKLKKIQGVTHVYRKE